MKKLTAAILLLVILISNIAIADDLVSYDYIMRIPMEDGYVVWDMMGTMRYVDNDGNVLWGEPFEASDVNDDGSIGDLGKFDGIINIYPFKNGYACISDYDKNLHYFDAEGYEVFNGEFEKISQYNTPFMPNDGILLGKSGDAYKIVDINGNVLFQFNETDFNAVGVPQEGMILAQGVNKGISSSTTYTAYYNTSGQEVMRFEDKTYVGAESNFSDGIAFLCEISGNEECVNWVMLDSSGNVTELQVPHNAQILDIRPFVSGERYTSALLWTGENKSVASVSRQGEIKILAEASNTNRAPQCYNGKCFIETIFDNDELDLYQRISLFCDLETGSLLDISSIPTLAGGKEYHTWFLDDGNIYVVVINKKYEYYFSTITPEGEIIKEPTFIARNGLLGFIEGETDDDHPVLGHNWGSKYSWQSFTLGKDRILSEKQLYARNFSKIMNQEEIGYCDIYGNIIIEGQYPRGADFNEGYALVCTDREGGYRKPYGRSLAIINTNGEIVERAEF